MHALSPPRLGMVRVENGDGEKREGREMTRNTGKFGTFVETGLLPPFDAALKLRITLSSGGDQRGLKRCSVDRESCAA